MTERVYDIDRQTGVVTVGQTAKQPDGQPINTQQLPATTRRTYLTNTKYTNASPLHRYGAGVDSRLETD